MQVASFAAFRYTPSLTRARATEIYYELIGADLRFTNAQLELLLPIIKREAENEPSNPEWRDLLMRLTKMRDYRMSKVRAFKGWEDEDV